MAKYSLKIALPEEARSIIENQVNSGRFPDPESVIMSGLHTLATQDAELDVWLRAEAVPALQEAEANPGTLVSFAEVLSSLKLDAEELQRAG